MRQKSMPERLAMPCWDWGRARDGAGYGAIWYEGRVQGAHRWVYEQLVGPIAKGLDLDHLCRNPRCVNPDHLEPVTHAENIRRGKVAKLTMDEARSIRAERARGVRAVHLATLYGVTRATIDYVVSGQHWQE